jgi:alkylation response protein AidB-like acyl-CoA dehydrogenase
VPADEIDAVQFADEVLFPSANEMDQLPLLPRERLDQIAAGGWYGLAALPEDGGAGISLEESYPIMAAFAGGCLTTTLVWMQHHGVVASITWGSNAELRADVLPALATGAKRATVAYAGLLPTPLLRARPDGDAWIVDGMAPWISGWGLTDVVLLSARTPDDDVVWLLADATESAQLQVTPQRLLALNASGTVTARFDGLTLGPERLANRMPYEGWPVRDQAGLRTNGSLAIGVAQRCCRLIGPSALDEELAERLATLDAATPDELPAARAAMSAFAMRSATALVAHQGSSSVVAPSTAERLVREATMLLVFASRPAIRAALLDDLDATAG